MSGLLSAISGKFTTTQVLGTLFPVTVFTILFRLLVIPIVPIGPGLPLLAPLMALEEKWEILVLTLVVIIVSGLLYSLNVPHVRLYEGYPWRDTWIGWRRVRRYQAQLDVLLAQQDGLPKLRLELKRRIQELAHEKAARSLTGSRKLETLEDSVNDINSLMGVVARSLQSDFPERPSVLPTRLGNVIRSFESYPRRRYGMSAIPLWPRLIAKVESSYSETIDAAKANLDFMINSTTLSALLAISLALAGITHAEALSSPGMGTKWLIQIFLFASLAYWLYRQSVGRALAWGSLVKGAFDLYRWELLTQLGYGRKPTDVEEEVELWESISKRMLFGNPPKGLNDLPTYSDASDSPATYYRQKGEAVLALTRGASPILNSSAISVSLGLRNADPQKLASDLVLVDTLPEGFEYEWDSAVVNSGRVTVEGTNLYYFNLTTSLQPGDSVLLSYKIFPRTIQDRRCGGST
ncbi:MAG TPA: hypothetical protein VN493_25640 [Thermoanaerobaculia bacterium]|nr:hypothetical protein [Thermoanaerobaculia bacterium]